MGGKANQTEKSLVNWEAYQGWPSSFGPTNNAMRFPSHCTLNIARPMSTDVHEGSPEFTQEHTLKHPLLCVQIHLVLKAKEKLNWRPGYFLPQPSWKNRGMG